MKKLLQALANTSTDRASAALVDCYRGPNRLNVPEKNTALGCLVRMATPAARASVERIFQESPDSVAPVLAQNSAAWGAPWIEEHLTRLPDTRNVNLWGHGTRAKHPDTQRWVRYLVGSLGVGGHTIPDADAFLRLFDHPIAEVRDEVAAAVERLRDVDLLLRLLNSVSGVRETAMQAIAHSKMAYHEPWELLRRVGDSALRLEIAKRLNPILLLDAMENRDEGKEFAKDSQFFLALVGRGDQDQQLQVLQALAEIRSPATTAAVLAGFRQMNKKEEAWAEKTVRAAIVAGIRWASADDLRDLSQLPITRKVKVREVTGVRYFFWSKGEPPREIDEEEYGRLEVENAAERAYDRDLHVTWGVYPESTERDVVQEMDGPLKELVEVARAELDRRKRETAK